MSRRHDQPPLFDPDTGEPLEEAKPADPSPSAAAAAPPATRPPGRRESATPAPPKKESRPTSAGEIGTRGAREPATAEELDGVANALVRTSTDGPGAVGHLPVAARQALEFRKQLRQVAKEMAGMSWGQPLEESTRMAIASWGAEFGVDIFTEIYLLGGRIYPNAALHLRKLGELVDAGVVEYAYPDHIHDDPRLVEAAETDETAAVELARRRSEQIRHNCPPFDQVQQCRAAVVFRVKLRSVDREFTGAKWCGDRGTRGGKQKDPVGAEFPVETAESRAARRCLRQFVSHLPAGWGDRFIAMEKAAEALEPMIKYDRDQFKAMLADLPAGKSVEVPGLPGLRFHSGWSPDTVPLKQIPGDPYQEPGKGSDAA